MTDYLYGGGAKKIEIAIADLSGGQTLGMLHEQKFYAIRAEGAGIKFPFPEKPFTALVDISQPVDDAILESYAAALVEHGCVQAVCRGDEAARLAGIFDRMAEEGGLDHDGRPFSCMCMDDEPLLEAIEYFVLPCGLAATGLLMVIGDSGDFQSVVDGFANAAGAAAKAVPEPDHAANGAVCFTHA